MAGGEDGELRSPGANVRGRSDWRVVLVQGQCVGVGIKALNWQAGLVQGQCVGVGVKALNWQAGLESLPWAAIELF